MLLEIFTMVNPKIIVYLEDDERKALFKLANTEKRDPRQQAAYLIRYALEKLDRLEPHPQTIHTEAPKDE